MIGEVGGLPLAPAFFLAAEVFEEYREVLALLITLLFFGAGVLLLVLLFGDNFGIDDFEDTRG